MKPKRTLTDVQLEEELQSLYSNSHTSLSSSRKSRQSESSSFQSGMTDRLIPVQELSPSLIPNKNMNPVVTISNKSRLSLLQAPDFNEDSYV